MNKKFKIILYALVGIIIISVSLNFLQLCVAEQLRAAKKDLEKVTPEPTEVSTPSATLKPTLKPTHKPTPKPSATESKGTLKEKTEYFEIYEIGIMQYRYIIYNNGKAVKDEIIKREPSISIKNNVLHIYANNDFFDEFYETIQFYDIKNNRFSVTFDREACEDAIIEEDGTALIAYFKQDVKDPLKNRLIIRDIFNDDGFTTVIDKEFNAETWPIWDIFFLNDEEIFLQYYTDSNGANEKLNREVIKFR